MMKPKNEEFHDRVVASLQSGDEEELAAVLGPARAADIAESFDLLSEADRSRVLFALPSHTAAEVIVMLDEAVRGDVVEDLGPESLSEIVAELPPDDAADVLGELSDAEIDEILGHIEAKQSDKIEGLLEYERQTAGGIMTPDVVALPATRTVADAVDSIRQASPDEDLHEIYVVDEERKVVGTVPLSRLVVGQPDTALSAICDRDVVTVFAGDDQETVVQLIRKYDVASAAVVDDEGRLVGRITHDDLLDVAEEEAAEDLFRMAGTDAAELGTSSVLTAARVRLTWLIPCMLGTLLTAVVLRTSSGRFDLALFAALAMFVPMIGGMSGNSGIQISTIIVRGFATGELGGRKLLRALLREGRITLAVAPACGVLAWALVSIAVPIFHHFDPNAPVLPHSGRVALAVGAGMTAGILAAAGLGIMLPFTLRRFGVDPAIASGPLVTTLNDSLAAASYMILAMLIAR